jgi:hypothetical protein
VSDDAFDMSHLVKNNTKANPKMIHAKQNLRKRMFEIERTKYKSKENNNFENRGSLKSQTSCHEEFFRENACKLSKKAAKR